VFFAAQRFDTAKTRSCQIHARSIMLRKSARGCMGAARAWIWWDIMSGGIGRLVVLTGLPGGGKTTLAIQFAGSLPACRMCPDDWMMAAGIDLWDDASRARIESFQLDLSLELLRAGQNVVIEWGVWAREERHALRNAARKIGAQVELLSHRPDG
jgi:AAA domain